MSDPPPANGQAGQESRPQYAEFDPNTLPQVSYGTEPEVVAPIEPDVTYHVAGGDAAPPAEVVKDGVQGLKGIWAKRHSRKAMWGVGLAAAMCIILAIGISVPLVGGKVGEAGDYDDEVSSSVSVSLASSTTASSTTATPTTSSSTSSSPKTTSLPGCERDKHTANVDWVGIQNGGGWDFELKAAGSALKCCAYCYKTVRECNAWLYVPSKGASLDCTLIAGYAGGDDADDECPGGRPGVVFNIANDKPENAAGSGPCAEDMDML